jgi:hypothetical protein
MPPMGGPAPQAQPPQDLPPQIKQKIMEALTSAGMQPAQAQQIMQAAINGDQQALQIIQQVASAGGGGAPGGGAAGGAMPPGGGMGG